MNIASLVVKFLTSCNILTNYFLTLIFCKLKIQLLGAPQFYTMFRPPPYEHCRGYCMYFLLMKQSQPTNELIQ